MNRKDTIFLLECNQRYVDEKNLTTSEPCDLTLPNLLVPKTNKTSDIGSHRSCHKGVDYPRIIYKDLTNLLRLPESFKKRTPFEISYSNRTSGVIRVMSPVNRGTSLFSEILINKVLSTNRLIYLSRQKRFRVLRDFPLTRNFPY